MKEHSDFEEVGHIIGGKGKSTASEKKERISESLGEEKLR